VITGSTPDPLTRMEAMSVFLITRGLPVVIELGLLVFCLIECIQTPAEDTRNLAKPWWILLILLIPLVGSIAWLVAGRPVRRHGSVPWPAGRTAGYPEYERPRRSTAPDDDSDFLRELGNVNAEHERTLAQWEADLRRREQELQHAKDQPKPPNPTADAPRTDPNHPGDS
jgi:hypothetical protein